MSNHTNRYDKVEIEGYVPSDEITWGEVEPSEGIARSGVRTCYRVPGVFVVSDGIVTEGREVRKFDAASRRVGYNASVVILGQVERVGRRWVAYTSAEEIGRYCSRAAAVRAVYARVRGEVAR